MQDIFASAKSVLSRAKHHIADLETTIKVFTPDKPYTHAIERDSQTGDYLQVLIFSESFSDDISCIMFDAVNNLRACLDQMTYAIAMRHRPGRNADKFVPFPFASDLNHWLNRTNGLKDDLPTQVRTLFGSFKPYKGGNNTLWAMNKLANTKKHAISCSGKLWQRAHPYAHGSAYARHGVCATLGSRNKNRALQVC
jgi:hypothetical protein